MNNKQLEHANESLALLDDSVSSPGSSHGRYRCQCGNAVFFGSNVCLACGTPLGYAPDMLAVVPLRPWSEPDVWAYASEFASTKLYKRCVNFAQNSGCACNWLVPLREAREHGLCTSCRLTRTIPALNDFNHPDNRFLWSKVENAKRQLVAALLTLGLPLTSRVSEDTQHGLAFDFLRASPPDFLVSTGHVNGVITLNIEEAIDANREAVREAMQEPYRTVLGHLRHEVGHYYWDRLVAKTAWHTPFATLFGDERQDYAQSLQRYYEQGPATDWASRHVSAYASAHPWEDWAETWAHYLHMRDAVATAHSLSMDHGHGEIEFAPFTHEHLYRPQDPDAEQFLAFVNNWVELTTKLNEMSRSMGHPDFYPFVLSRMAVTKLHFVHLVIAGA